MSTELQRLSDITANVIARHAPTDAAAFLASYIRNGSITAKAMADLSTAHPDARRRLTYKAAVAPGDTTNATWAQPLAKGSPITDAIVEAARSASVLAALPIVPVPANTPIAVETAQPSAAWVGEGAPIPVTQIGYGLPRVPAGKVATIVVLTSELVRVAAPASAQAIRNALASAITKAVDTLLLGVAAPVATVSPGGIFNGVTPLAPSGTTAAAAAADALRVVAAHLTATPDPSRSAVLMPPATAALVMSQIPTAFSDGTFLTLPLVISAAVGNKIAAVDAGRLLVSDDGLELDIANYASVQMVDNPDNPITAATICTSFWQSNLVGVKAIRFVSWAWATPAPQATLVAPTAYVPGTLTVAA